MTNGPWCSKRSRSGSTLTALLGLVAATHAQVGLPGELVGGEQKLSATAGGFHGDLDGGDHFGRALTSLGRVDDDAVPDAAVGAPGDDDGGTDRGAVWVLFLDDNGKAHGEQKLSATAGNFTGSLADGDRFGTSVTVLPDLDGDGIAELAVGAPSDDDGGNGRGAVWILFLDEHGQVKRHQKISSTSGGFTGQLDDGDQFGFSLTTLGAGASKSAARLVVGAPGDDDAAGEFDGTDRGAVWILDLNREGLVQRHSKISDVEGGLGPVLFDRDDFGFSVAGLGDLNGDLVPDLAVGSVPESIDPDQAPAGHVYVLLLANDDTVSSYVRIGSGLGGFTGTVAAGDRFGFALGRLPDLDGDSLSELAVGAPRDDDTGNLDPLEQIDRGAVWILFLGADGLVKTHAKVSASSGGFGGTLSPRDEFGSAVATLLDLDGDGVEEWAVGAPLDDDAAQSDPDTTPEDLGAAWVLFPTAAEAESNNGSGINPEVFVSSTPPKLGTVWSPVISSPSPPDPGDPIVVFLGGSLKRPNQFEADNGPVIIPGAGELLISFAPEDFILCLASFLDVPFMIIFPPDPNLVGLELFTQGFIFNVKTNGLTFTNGYDLILGF